ncbi:MAG TPA: DUF2218 domain-containing protein [Micromonosporaceae bacterium]|nr:DUF2218 domain-containing protein [Micromonosporaceae bacterium]
MLTSRADVVTQTPDRYAKQLVSHLGHRIEFRSDGADAEFNLGSGRGVIRVGDGVLTLLAEATDPAVLAQIQDVLGRHLERFGTRQELVVDWQATAG